MSKTTTISLRAGERLFINGAVIRADRKMTFEILNDVPYLYEHQIMQVGQTTTATRQLYYVLQTMIMEPASIAAARDVFECSSTWILNAAASADLVAGIKLARDYVYRGEIFQALKAVRELFAVEDRIMGVAHPREIRLLEAV